MLSYVFLSCTITDHQKESRDHSLQGGLVKKLNVRYELFKCKNHRQLNINDNIHLLAL